MIEGAIIAAFFAWGGYRYNLAKRLDRRALRNARKVGFIFE